MVTSIKKLVKKLNNIDLAANKPVVLDNLNLNTGLGSFLFNNKLLEDKAVDKAIEVD